MPKDTRIKKLEQKLSTQNKNIEFKIYLGGGNNSVTNLDTSVTAINKHELPWFEFLKSVGLKWHIDLIALFKSKREMRFKII